MSRWREREGGGGRGGAGAAFGGAIGECGGGRRVGGYAHVLNADLLEIELGLFGFDGEDDDKDDG